MIGQRAGLLALAGILGAAALALGLGWWAWPAPPDLPEVRADVSALVPLGDGPTFLLPADEFEAPGIKCPPAVPAATAALPDDEPVVGVRAGGRSRAYVVRALARDAESHIINDVLGGVPVSVTHCDIYRCTRVFTGGPADEPLDLSQGGVKAGGMVLESGGRAYRQDSGESLTPGGAPLPYAPLPCEETTWGEWRRSHPDTDVYTGEPAAGPR